MASFLASSRILAVGAHVPETRVPSGFIEEAFELAQFGIPAGSIERLTGIRERRVSTAETEPSDLALAACKDALAQAALDPAELDVIVYAAVSRDYLEPATAHVIQATLGARRAFVLDVSNACLSIMSGMALVDGLIACGRVRRGLICGGELSGDALRVMCLQMAKLKTREDFIDRFAMFTLGEAGAAVILEPKEAAPGRALHAFELASRGEHWPLCTLKPGGEPMLTDSAKLLAAGIGLAGERLDALLERSGWTRADIDVVIPHQVSLPANRKLLEALALPLERSYVVVHDYGNTASTTIPLTLAHAAASGRLQSGTRALLVGVGSGVSVGLATLVW